MDQENNTITEVNFTKNDDVSKQHHQFCLNNKRFRPCEDPTLTARILQAEKLYQSLKQQRAETNDKLQQKKTDRERVTSNLKLTAGINCRSSLKEVTTWAVWHKKGLQCLLGEISGSRNQRRLKDVETCSSVKELDNLIRKLHSKLQHGSSKRAEEKDLFGEINKAKLVRENPIADAAANKNLASSQEERVQYIGQRIEGLKTEDMAFWTKMQQHRKSLMAREKDIRRLEKKLTGLNIKKAQAYQRILELGKRRDGEVET